MKKLIIATTAILAATLVSGGAFAIPGGATKTLEAPAATVKVSCRHYHRAHRHHYHAQCCGYHRCCGYYSLYTYTTPCCNGGGCGCGGYYGLRTYGGWGTWGWAYGGGFYGGLFGW